MGNIDIDLYDHNSKKSECPFLYKKGTPNHSSLGSSQWHDDSHRPSPNYVFSVASHEQFEKSRLVALQEAALHDSTVLEMGYQMTDCETRTPTSEGVLLKDPSISPLLRNPLEEIEGHKAPKLISLRDLKVGKVHRGRMLSGTLCCKTVKTSAIMNVLEEDGTDDAMRLVISNPMHKNITTAKSQLLYPKGAKISVQDPYLKRFADGMVGILVENPTEIIFNYLPKEVPSLEKQNIKEELASKRRVGKVQTERPASDKELTECIKKIFWKERIDVDGESQSSLSKTGTATDQLSASDTELTLCLKKILSKEPGDMDGGNQSSEGTLSTCGSTPGISINATPMKISSPMDEGSLKLQELAAPTFVQNDLDSSVERKGSLNLDQGCEEVENSPLKLAEKGSQDCDDLNHNPDNQTLLDCMERKSVVPQKLSDKCAPIKLNGDTCKGHESNRAKESSLLKNSGVEQEKTDRTQASHGRTDGKRTFHEIDEVSSEGDILETLETSADFTKLTVDDSLEKNTQTKGSRECGPEICESSNGKPMENSTNEISVSCNDGSKSSPSTTITEKESDSMNSKGNLENNAADGTAAEAHVTPTALRLLGNKYFAQQNWAKAIDLYTQASFKAIQDSVQETKENLSPNRDKILGFFEPQKDASPQKEEHESEVVMDYSNRAEAWLRIHQYERAWADSERALSLDPHHLKSLFRKGRALLGLGDYQQALAHFEACNARTQSDKDVLAAIKLTRIADQQNRLGIYDLTDYYMRGRFAGEVPNFADYIGPVQVKAKIGENGRGLFLAKSVEAGDVLLVSNPLAFVQLESQVTSKSDSNAPAGRPTSYEYNPRVSAESEEKLAKLLLERAKVSSKNCHRLLTLCHDEESSHQAAPPMDLFISGRQVLPPTEPVETEELDAIRLHQIIARNAITRNMVSTTLERRHVFHGKNHAENRNDNFVGLWVLPSFINHSCIPNVSLVTIGKCIFVYASRDMDLGEELYCSYYNVFQPLHQRKELASRWWAFQCKCARCLVETKFTTILERLRSHHAQIQPTPTFVMRFPPSAEKAVAKEIAIELEILHTTDKLDNPEKSWLQASFTQLYIAAQDTIGGHGACAPLDTAFGAMETLRASSTTILEVGLLCREYMGRDFKGKRTPKYKVVNQRLIRACKCIFGKHRASVLQSLVEGIPPK